jgi:phage FluMu protein Com
MDDGSDPAVDEQRIDVKCPHCHASHQITWPMGHKYVVIPKSL